MIVRHHRPFLSERGIEVRLSSLDTDSEGDELGDENDEEEVEEVEESLDSNSENEDAKDEGPTAEKEDLAAGDEGLAAGDRGPSMRVKILGLGWDETKPEGQSWAASIMETVVGEPLGLGYGALGCREIASRARCLTPPSPEWSSGSLLVSLVPSIVSLPISSPMISLTIPLPGGLIRDHTVRLGEISPALFERYDRDIWELFTRSGVRPVLALVSWAGHVDTWMAGMSRVGYDVHRLVHDMLLQQAALQRELQEMRCRVTALKQEKDRREMVP
nr:hypothetical protein [Tanacetum cinerariifolium]